MRRDANSVWLVTDAFLQKWRISIVPMAERALVKPVSRWDIPENPLFHIIHHAFNDSGALHDSIAAPLLAIYDVLSGTQLHRAMPRPTNDPQRKLRGFKAELSRALYAAQEAGILRFERHELPWPFPDKEERPDPRDTPEASNELSFYEIALFDELEKPLSGIRIRMETPSGTLIQATDGAGHVRVDNAPSGVGRAQIANAAEFEKALAGRERKPRRKTPLPEGKEWHFCVPSRLEETVAIPAGEVQKIMVITRSHFGHFAQGTSFRDLSLRSEGPWLLEENDACRTLEMHSSGSAGDAVICVPTESAPTEPAADAGALADWIRAAVDALHESLFDGKVESIWSFLEGIPLDAPPTEEESAAPIQEELLFTEALAGLKAEGWDTTTVEDEGKQV